jgi:uncharacterized protein
MTKLGIKQRIQEDMKIAMKAHEKERLGVIRFILAAIKQREIDERITLNDSQSIVILEKLLKQRRDSITHFANAGREELVKKEEFEISILQSYLPEQLAEEAIKQLIDEAIKATNAVSIRDMGKIMAFIKPKVQGCAEMAVVSALVKDKLSDL